MRRKLNRSAMLFQKRLIGLTVFLILFLTSRKVIAQQTPKNSLRLKSSKYGYLADIIEAQAKHETNNYRSELSVNANNLFGMKIPTKRNSVSTGTYQIGNNVYLRYKDKDQSIQDFIMYLDYVGFPKVNSVDEYVRTL